MRDRVSCAKVELPHNNLAKGDHIHGLKKTPFLYALCQHKLLSRRGYRKAFIRGYLLIYRVDEVQGVVYIERFFSDMEDFEQKL